MVFPVLRGKWHIQCVYAGQRGDSSPCGRHEDFIMLLRMAQNLKTHEWFIAVIFHLILSEPGDFGELQLQKAKP